MIALLAVLAGGVGAVARFVVDGLIRARLSSDYPWATLAINVTGSLLLGVLTGLVLAGRIPNDVRVIVGTGFCGGYTTFSTASFEAMRLARGGRGHEAFGYVVAGVGLSAAAAALGLLVTL